MTFWNNTATIEGWFSFDEAQQYMALLEELPPNPIVVEVGIYHGKSTSVPGQLSLTRPMRLVCIDIFGIDYDGLPFFAKFLANMKRLGIENFEAIIGDSNTAKDKFPSESVDLVFIDGDHNKAGVELDCDVWLPRLKKGGMAVFHDYDPIQCWDVYKAVNIYCKGWEGSHVNHLAYRRKP